jgi:non-homologous end joining protein Ku
VAWKVFSSGSSFFNAATATRAHHRARGSRQRAAGVTLRYSYEVRKEEEYFDDIRDEKFPKDMLDLAKHIDTYLDQRMQ